MRYGRKFYDRNLMLYFEILCFLCSYLFLVVQQKADYLSFRKN